MFTPWQYVYPLEVCLPLGSMFIPWQYVYPLEVCLPLGSMFTS